MPTQCGTVVANDVNIIEKLSFYCLQNQDIILLLVYLFNLLLRSGDKFSVLSARVPLIDKDMHTVLSLLNSWLLLLHVVAGAVMAIVGCTTVWRCVDSLLIKLRSLMNWKPNRCIFGV